MLFNKSLQAVKCRDDALYLKIDINFTDYCEKHFICNYSNSQGQFFGTDE